MKASSPTRVSALYAVAALICACQSGPSTVPATAPANELLNSERIELTFGNVGIEVLSEDVNLRVSNLYSIEEEGRICRTFAVVSYPERIDPALAEAHAFVVGGQPIGETFAAAGWSMEKQHRYFGEITDVQSRPRVADLMGLEGPASAAIHVYVFVVSRNGHAIDYATIAEVHHPAYLGFRDLEALYGSAVQSLSSERAEVQSILATVLRELQED